MGVSRWWRERRFEQAYRRAVRSDQKRIGAEFESRFKESKTGNDFDAVMSEYLKATRLPDLRLETIRSRAWRRKAERFGIDMPREWWAHDEEHDLWYLTPEGRRQLAKRLTQERVWTVRQWFNALVPPVALIIGLLGAVIGLLAMWRWP